MANVSLDLRLEDQVPPFLVDLKGEQYSEGLSPYVRLSGVQVDINLKYYNYRLNDTDMLSVRGISYGAQPAALSIYMPQTHLG